MSKNSAKERSHPAQTEKLAESFETVLEYLLKVLYHRVFAIYQLTPSCQH